MTNYAVVQARFEKIDAEHLQSVLSEHGGLTRPDASRVANRVEGILWERFDRETAERVVAALADYGYKTRAIPVDTLPSLEKPRTIRWLQMTERGMEVPWTLDQETVFVPWTNLFVISAGEIGKHTSQVVTRRKLVHAEYEHPLEERVESRARLERVVDVIAVDEQGAYIHLRMPEEDLVYRRILGEDQGVAAPHRKFKVFLRQLIEHASAAVVSPRTRRLLVDSKPRDTTVKDVEYASAQTAAFEHYNRWLLQLVMLNEQADRDSD